MEKMNPNWLKHYLNYNQETGKFYWKALGGSRNAVIGELVNKPHSEGYETLYLCKETVLAHRAAVAYMVGKWPDHHVDHKNTIKNDNRWENLREATRSQNIQNSKDRPNKWGFRGVSKKGERKFVAKITVDKKTYFLGTFPTPEEASVAYRKARQTMHTFSIDYAEAPENQNPPIPTPSERVAL